MQGLKKSKCLGLKKLYTDEINENKNNNTQITFIIKMFFEYMPKNSGLGDSYPK